MSCSKPLPPFVCDSLYYLNRHQLEKFSIVCRPLKNFIERYLHTKPYRVFDGLEIRPGSYALVHNDVQWHPNRGDYSVQQFLAAQKCIIDESKYPWDYEYYSLAEMRPYLGPTFRIKETFVSVNGGLNYDPEHINEMESMAYLWRDYNISITNAAKSLIVAEHFQPIINSPTILQCRKLHMMNVHFSFKHYKVLYTVKVIKAFLYNGDDDIDSNYWLQFLEQPRVKPIVALQVLRRNIIENALDRIKQAFPSAVVPNAFKVVFVQQICSTNEPLPKFREINKTSGEMLELKEGLPVEYPEELLGDFEYYTLDRSAI